MATLMAANDVEIAVETIRSLEVTVEVGAGQLMPKE